MKKSVLVGLLSLSVLPAAAFAQAIPEPGEIYTNTGNCSTSGYSGSTSYVNCTVNDTLDGGITATGTLSYQCQGTGLPSALSCSPIGANVSASGGDLTSPIGLNCSGSADCAAQGYGTESIILFNPNTYDY